MARSIQLCVAALASLLPYCGAIAADCSVAVTVQDDAGHPIQDAKVSILRWTGNWNETGIESSSNRHGRVELSGLQTDVYLTVRVVAQGFATTMFDVEFSKPEKRDITLTLSPPASPIIKVLDPEGRPIAGAEIMRMEFVDTNKSSVYMTKKTARALRYNPRPSDESGALLVPAVPAGARLTLSVMHPQWTSVALKNVVAADGQIASVKMRPGVALRIELVPTGGAEESLDARVADVKLLSSASGNEPLSIIHPFTVKNNHIELTAYPCEYQRLTIKLDDYFVTPELLNHVTSPLPLIDLSTGHAEKIQLNVRPRVKAKGRVVDRDGQPMQGVSLYGAVNAISDQWPEIVATDDSNASKMMKLRSEWGSGGSAETDRDGRYEIELAAGKAYVETIHMGYFARPHVMKFEVADDGSTEIPSITLLPVPTLRGVVTDQEGRGLGGILVRMRSSGFGDAEPVDATAGDGSFELQMSRIPYMKNGDGLVSSVFVVAVDPKSNLAGIAEADVADAEATGNIEIKLSPRTSQWVLNPIDEAEDPDYIEQLEEQTARLETEYPDGLHGKSAPDLSEGTWLNSEARSLKDFRGKYVLLDFWFIGCGPCMRDMPSVKMAQEMFGDQNFSVVSVHRNGQTPDSVRAFAKANGMDYPIVVDNADGAITEQYRLLGVSGYPSHILLDPEGKIIHNDNVSLPPSLRRYKLERIYEALRR